MGFGISTHPVSHHACTAQVRDGAKPPCSLLASGKVGFLPPPTPCSIILPLRGALKMGPVTRQRDQHGPSKRSALAEKLYMLKMHICERYIHTSTCSQYKACNTGIPSQGAAIHGASCSGTSPSCLHIVSIPSGKNQRGLQGCTNPSCNPIPEEQDETHPSLQLHALWTMT